MNNPPFKASDAQVRLVEGLLQGKSVNDTIELSVGTVGVIINRLREAEADELNALDLCSAAIEDYNVALDRIKTMRVTTILECADIVRSVARFGDAEGHFIDKSFTVECLLSLLEKKP